MCLPRFAYFPFGGGSRTCIGSGLAHLETSLILSAMCRRFTLSVPAGFEARPFLGVTLLPEDGLLPVEVRQGKGRPLPARSRVATVERCPW